MIKNPKSLVIFLTGFLHLAYISWQLVLYFIADINHSQQKSSLTINIEGLQSLPFYILPNCDLSSGNYLPGLTTHPMRMLEDLGTEIEGFVIWCQPGRSKLDPGPIAQLPTRSPSSPYAIFSHSLQHDKCSREFDPSCKAWFNILSSRNDVLYMGMERSDHRLCDNEGKSALPGFSLPPVTNMTENNAINVLKRKYLVSFAGQNHEGWFGSSMVRPWLFRSHRLWTHSSNHTDDVIISQKISHWEYKVMLAESKFALVPRGDGRWNNRLFDLIQSGTIPVFLSDGLEPPFSPLIQWDAASLTMPEMQALDFEGLIHKLRAVPDNHLQSMTNQVHEIRKQCFETREKMADCLSRTASILIRKKVFTGPPVAAAQRMRVPLCPSIVRDSGDGTVLYENNSFHTWNTLY